MKTESIEIRVTADEKATMRSAAERDGLSLSSWLRMVALAAAEKRSN
jgi:uncharacterized protein (DUF1778 family)